MTDATRSDPSALTTAMVHREVLVLDSKMDDQFAALKELMLEKLIGVDRQFELVERMRVEQKKDTKDAVDAALTAQKEAVKEQTTAFALATTKSESSMTKQIEQLREAFDAAIKGVTNLLNDVKDRQTRSESIKLGGQDLTNNKRADVGLYVAIGAVVLTGLSPIVQSLIAR